MNVIHKNTGRLFPYLIYFIAAGLCLSVTLVAVYNFGVNISGWKIPDTLRIVNTIPALIGACGLFGLIPDTFLSKKKRAAISYFVNSDSFKDFVVFWFSIAGIQLIFILIHAYAKAINIIIQSLDIATTLASFVCLLITGALFLQLFYGRK